MMRLKLFVLATAILIAACEPAALRLNDTAGYASTPEALYAYEPKSASDVSEESSVKDQHSEGKHSSTSFLAYRYNMTIDLPLKKVANTAQHHMQLCQDAGPSKCQVLTSQTSERSSDYVNSDLSIRAEPKWLAEFQATIRSDVKDADGRIVATGVTAEDLTRSIIDTDSRLNALLTLRGRLRRTSRYAGREII